MQPSGFNLGPFSLQQATGTQPRNMLFPLTSGPDPTMEMNYCCDEFSIVTRIKVSLLVRRIPRMSDKQSLPGLRRLLGTTFASDFRLTTLYEGILA